MYSCIEPITDPLLPREHAGFRGKKSIVDQVTFLTQKIENSFSAKEKTGVVFVHLTAVYDTVWHRGFTCKLLRLLPNRHMVSLIMELVHNPILPSPAVTENKASYDTLRMAFYKDQFWLSSCLISIYMTYQ